MSLLAPFFLRNSQAAISLTLPFFLLITLNLRPAAKPSLKSIVIRFPFTHTSQLGLPLGGDTVGLPDSFDRGGQIRPAFDRWSNSILVFNFLSSLDQTLRGKVFHRGYKLLESNLARSNSFPSANPSTLAIITSENE